VAVVAAAAATEATATTTTTAIGLVRSSKRKRGDDDLTTGSASTAVLVPPLPEFSNKETLTIFTTTAAGAARPPLLEQKQDPEEVPSTMGQAVRTFFLGPYHGPRIVTAALAGWVALRAWYAATDAMGAGALTVHDATAFAAAVAFWWIQEHFVHSAAPWYGRTVHEHHHAKPYHHISIDPAPLMVCWMVTVHALLAWVLPAYPLAITATVAYAGSGLLYEWMHYIAHTRVRFDPRHDSSSSNNDSGGGSKAGRGRKRPGGVVASYMHAMKNHHIRHHRVDSSYWLAFTVPAVDTLFGTNPEVQDVRKWQKLEPQQRQQQRGT
jgi:hypothetical protein